jgi:hypothetical protein
MTPLNKIPNQSNREQHNNPRNLDEILPASSDGHWSIATALKGLSGDTVIDGELVALGPDGRPDFNLLQNFRSAESRIHYYAFDILIHKGRRLTELPLSERRAILSSVIEPEEHVALSEVSDGVRELIQTDARVLVADRFAGPIIESPYFGNYERWPVSWRLALGRVDGELAVIALIWGVDKWTPHSVVQVSLIGDRIARITDYGHCEWILAHARTVTFEQPARHNEDC